MDEQYKSFSAAYAADRNMIEVANKTNHYLAPHPEVVAAIEEKLKARGITDLEDGYTGIGGISLGWRTSRDQFVRAVLTDEEPDPITAATIIQPVKIGTFLVGPIRVEIMPFNHDLIGLECSREAEAEMNRITAVMELHGYSDIDMSPISLNNAYLPDGTIIGLDRGAAEILPGITQTAITEAPWVHPNGTLRQWDYYPDEILPTRENGTLVETQNPSRHSYQMALQAGPERFIAGGNTNRAVSDIVSGKTRTNLAINR